MSSEATLTGPREQALDGLRGIAVLLVIGLHTLHFEQFKPFWYWVNQVLKAGWMGVDLFFVLSGFLITRILIRTRDDPHRARNFYARRALRILPAYFVYLLVVYLLLVLLAAPATLHSAFDWLPYFLVFAQNLYASAISDSPPVRELSHLWSLAVEEQFYLFWPWLVWRIRSESLSRLCLWVIAFAWSFKLVLTLAGTWPHAVYIHPLARMDGFAVGAYLAVWQLAGRPPLPVAIRAAPWVASAILLVLFLDTRGLDHHSGLNTSVTVLMFGGLLQRALVTPPGSPLQRLLGSRLLIFFGTYSYGLYLIHYGVDTVVWLKLRPLLGQHLHGNALQLVAPTISLGLSVLLALTLHRWVEAPALRLKHHFTGLATSPRI